MLLILFSEKGAGLYNGLVCSGWLPGDLSELLTKAVCTTAVRVQCRIMTWPWQNMAIPDRGLPLLHKYRVYTSPGNTGNFSKFREFFSSTSDP